MALTSALAEDRRVILEAWQAGLRPDPELTVSQWADRHRVLSSESSSEAGPWQTDRTPYLRAIMDALSASDPCRRVVFMKGAQVGGSEAGNNWMGYVIQCAPGPMLVVQPTLSLAKRFARQRIEPMIAACPELRERVAPVRSRSGRNKLLAKDFPGGLLVLTGANSAVELRSMPARYLFLDESDGYPVVVDGEGDPVDLAEARADTFTWRAKSLLVSTPTLATLSRIARAYRASDQRRYFVPCPHCGAFQWLRFARLRWDPGRPATAVYSCEGCEQPIAEHHKTAMLARGEWRPTAAAQDPLTIGFHLSSLYSPLGWKSWAAIARQYEAAAGDEARLRVFTNTVLGETWTEPGDAPEWEVLYGRRGDHPLGTVPAGGLFLTAGVDVQRNRIEVSIWAWGRGLTSWLVDHHVIEGGPEHAASWTALTALLGRTWPHESGARLGLARLAIDTGYEKNAVQAWARAVGYAQVMPVRGIEGFNRPAPVLGPSYVDVLDGGRKVRRGARLWTVAVSDFKVETYRFLRLPRPTAEELAAGAALPAGSLVLPAEVPGEWVKQLVAEKLVTVRTRRGYSTLEWHKLRERNEALDCRVYARAAAWLAGVDRWPEAQWADLEAQLVASAAAAASEAAGPASGTAGAATPSASAPASPASEPAGPASALPERPADPPAPAANPVAPPDPVATAGLLNRRPAGPRVIRSKYLTGNGRDWSR